MPILWNEPHPACLTHPPRTIPGVSAGEPQATGANHGGYGEMQRWVELAALVAQVAALQDENSRLRDMLATCRGHLVGSLRATSACLTGVDEALNVGQYEAPVSGPQSIVLTDSILECHNWHCVERQVAG